MSLSYKNIRTTRQWRSATGLTENQFHDLILLFKNSYERLYGKSIEQRGKDNPNSAIFNSYEELLFFGLYSFKSGLTLDLLALSFDMSLSNASQYQKLFIQVLEKSFIHSGHLPKRTFENQTDLKEQLLNQVAVLLDVTEQPIQRAVNQKEQKKDYSGKKSPIP